MSINYTNLFTDLGSFLARINEFRTQAVTTLPTKLTTIETVLDAEGLFDILGEFPALFAGFQDSVITLAGDMGDQCETRLTHQTTIVAQLIALQANAGIGQILPELIIDMIANSQTIKKCATTLGSVTANGANHGTGKVFVDKVLDGATSPGNNFPAHRKYVGLNSELTVPSETMLVQCISDASNGGSEGAESFQVNGATPPTQVFDWQFEGSGVGPTFQCFNGTNLISNGEFENWSVTDTPDSWTVVAGTVSTHIKEDTAAPLRGLADLKLFGDGVQANIQIKQTMTNFVPLKRYMVGFWYKCDLGGGDAGNLTVSFIGTGYSAGSSEKIAITPGSYSATYAGVAFFVNMPALIPSDFALSIQWNGTPTNAKHLWIDGMVCSPAIYHGGICMGAMAGATQFLVGDRFTFTVANDGAGLFQTLFRRRFNYQLPSASSPSISDALVT